MTFKASTGLRNTLLTDDSFAGVMSSAKLRIYSGPVPATADAVLSGATLLVEISDDDTGTALSFETSAVDGALSKLSSQVWSGTCEASGTASFYRLVNDADDGTESTTAPRVQGSIGVAGADMNISNPTLVALALQPVDYFSVALPTL